MSPQHKPNHFPNLFSRDKGVIKPDGEISSVTKHEHNGLVWIDVQNPTREAVSKLADEYKLHEVHIAQCYQKDHIAQVNPEAHYIFTTLNFPYFVPHVNRIEATQVNMFLGKRFLITIHGSEYQLLRQLFDASKDSVLADAKSAADILYHVTDRLLNDTASIIQNVFQELDAMENAVFDDKNSDAYQIGQLRQKIIGLRKALSNQNETLEELSNAVGLFSEGHLKRHFRKNANTSRNLWEATHEAKETIEVYKDVDFTSHATKTNQILAVLTLLFTLTIPATVIGAFYGMNILLPGGIVTGSWTFLGSYTTLKVICSVSILSAIGMFAYFRQKRWF